MSSHHLNVAAASTLAAAYKTRNYAEKFRDGSRCESIDKHTHAHLTPLRGLHGHESHLAFSVLVSKNACGDGHQRRKQLSLRALSSLSARPQHLPLRRRGEILLYFCACGLRYFHNNKVDQAEWGRKSSISASGAQTFRSRPQEKESGTGIKGSFYILPASSSIYILRTEEATLGAGFLGLWVSVLAINRFVCEFVLHSLTNPLLSTWAIDWLPLAPALSRAL